jgi:hypothetical protein
MREQVVSEDEAEDGSEEMSTEAGTQKRLT